MAEGRASGPFEYPREAHEKVSGGVIEGKNVLTGSKCSRMYTWIVLHSWKRYNALCILILLAHNGCFMEDVWRIHQSVYITQTLGHIRTHYTSFITSTLHILYGGCVTRASHIHCIYFIEHMWHIPTDVNTTHKSCGYTTYTPWCIHSICTMEDVSCIRGVAYAEQYSILAV